MTATPRIYTEAAQTRAKESDVGIYSMDDTNQYGPEFYRLRFGQAVDEGLLSDYRVIVLNIAQGYVANLISKLDQDIKKLDPAPMMRRRLSAATRCFVIGQGEDGIMLKRAVSFSSSIRNSRWWWILHPRGRSAG